MARRVAFDTSVLTYLINPDAKSRHDNLPYKQERIAGFLKDLKNSGDEVLIPTPVLAELLEGAAPEAASEVLQIFNGSKQIHVAAFDEIAAIEYGFFMGDAKHEHPRPKELKRKLKFDCQILAICKTRQVSTIYVDDDQLQNRAQRHNIEALGLPDLPFPDSERQSPLDLPIKEE